MSELGYPSEIFVSNESLHEILEFKFRNMGNADFERRSRALFVFFEKKHDQILRGTTQFFEDELHQIFERTHGVFSKHHSCR